MGRQFRWLLLIVWTVAGATRAADETPGKPLFPLDPGLRWSYEDTQKVEQIQGQRTNVTYVTGTVNEEIFRAPPQYRDNANVVLLRSTFKRQSESGKPEDVSSGGFVQLLEWHGSDLYLHGIRVWIEGSYSEDMNLYDPPFLYLKGAARVDESWTVGTQRIMGVRMPTLATMDGLETVTVPAGTFSNCVKVSYVTWKMSGVVDTPNGKLLVQDGNARDIVWFAKGIGIVKESQLKTTVYATGQGSTVTREEDTKLLESHTLVK
ncbi:MAG TPA: hypothetical protein VL486_02520 [Verrucomicrobiae bacterium]|nr:hypothetical protein [Verrucomicrobiae bacterium]